MKGPYLSRDEARAIDQIAIAHYGMSGLVLMENAGRGAAEWIHQWVPNGTICILCGLGNNGGDGFVIARHLEWLQRKRPSLYLVASATSAVPDGFSNDARTNYQILVKAGFEVRLLQGPDDRSHEWMQADAIVDAVLGTGARLPLPPSLAEVMERANRSKALRIAIDLPTGLDCDTGEIDACCFRADKTITFVAPKKGFLVGDGPKVVGEVVTVPIGIPLSMQPNPSAA